MSDMSDYEDDPSGQPPPLDGTGSGSSTGYDPKRHAREQHNALERRRRDNIKDMYTSLREVVPDANGERVQASRAVILKKAIETIEKGQADATTLAADVVEQEARNAKMREEIARLKAKKKATAVAAASNVALMRPTPVLPLPQQQHVFLPPFPPNPPPK